MSKPRYSQYSPATGLLSGCVTTADMSGQPAGWIEGAHDAARWRVDVATGQVVAYVPPAPADTALETHVWDAASHRWLPKLTPAGHMARQAAQARALRDRRLAASDWTQMLDAPLAPARRAVWAAYRQALRNVPAQAGFPTNVAWPVAPGDAA